MPTLPLHLALPVVVVVALVVVGVCGGKWIQCVSGLGNKEREPAIEQGRAGNDQSLPMLLLPLSLPLPLLRVSLIVVAGVGVKDQLCWHRGLQKWSRLQQRGQRCHGCQG